MRLRPAGAGMRPPRRRPSGFAAARPLRTVRPRFRSLTAIFRHEHYAEHFVHFINSDQPSAGPLIIVRVPGEVGI